MFEDIERMFEQNLRLEAASQVISGEALIALDKAMERIYDECDDDLQQAINIIEWTVKERFL